MPTVPKILRNTKAIRRIRAYMDTRFTEVLHTTLNPEGPGVIRIHLVPPKKDENGFNPSVAVINGTDIVPVNFGWTILLAELIREVNKYDGRSISEEELEKILTAAAENARKVLPLLRRKRLQKDVRTIYTTFRQIAYREPVNADIRHMNIGEYADCMKAPHRIDLMVSAMTKNGQWHCNQKCVHCYAAGQVQAEEEELTTEEWKLILDKCRAAGIPQITFTGGEPTMREDLPELIAYARWFVSRLNTNGIRLTEDYCRRLKAAEVDSVQITFYAADETAHNTLVGAAQYRNTVAGIENALKAGLMLSINTPLCSLNRDYVQTLRFLHEKGIRYVTCSGLITTGNAAGEDSRSLQLKPEELEQILRDAAAYCHANDMEIAFTSPGWIRESVFAELGIPAPSCGACLSNMAVTPGGHAVPCQSWLSGDILGNMLTDDWESIWTDPVCESLRNYSAELTGKCPLRRYC